MPVPPVATWVTEANPDGPPADPARNTPLRGDTLTQEFQRARDYADQQDAITLATAESSVASELDYAEITTDFPTSSPSAVDVPGLIISPVCDGRPILLEFYGTAAVVAAGGLPQILFYDVTAGAVVHSATLYWGDGVNAGQGGTAQTGMPVSIRRRVNPPPGVRVYKVQLLAFGGVAVKIGAGLGDSAAHNPGPAFFTATVR